MGFIKLYFSKPFIYLLINKLISIEEIYIYIYSTKNKNSNTYFLFELLNKIKKIKFFKFNIRSP